jgi:hypothetical protein
LFLLVVVVLVQTMVVVVAQAVCVARLLQLVLAELWKII